VIDNNSDARCEDREESISIWPDYFTRWVADSIRNVLWWNYNQICESGGLWNLVVQIWSYFC